VAIVNSIELVLRTPKRTKFPLEERDAYFEIYLVTLKIAYPENKKPPDGYKASGGLHIGNCGIPSSRGSAPAMAVEIGVTH
jgi:hypothetical protein